jgi:hypothetical protein
MSKRICYIHIGPHKTGTSSIQWFLQENRAELLKYGYFVPETRQSTARTIQRSGIALPVRSCRTTNSRWR